MGKDCRGVAPGSIVLAVLAALLVFSSPARNGIERRAVMASVIGRTITAPAYQGRDVHHTSITADGWTRLDVPPGGLRPVFDSLEKITFGGILDDFDYAIIRRRLKQLPRVFDKKISGIEVRSATRIEVCVGTAEKSFSGSGQIIVMERRGDDWVVVDVVWWAG
jgi:hypothetical protein